MIHSFWVPGAHGQEGRRARPDNHLTHRGRQAGHLPRAVRGVLRALARQHALPRDREEPPTTSRVAQRAAAGPGEPLTVECRRRRRSRSRGRRQDLLINTFECTNCHIVRRLVEAELRPEPHPPASRTMFASGTYQLNRKNLIDWVMNAPSMIPMESRTAGCHRRRRASAWACRRSPRTRRQGQQTMTQQQAETDRRLPAGAEVVSAQEPPMTTVADVHPDRRAARRCRCGGRRRPPASGAGSPPSTTRRSASSTAAPRWSSS